MTPHLSAGINLPSQLNAFSLLGLYPTLQEQWVAVRLSHCTATEFTSHMLPCIADVIHSPTIASRVATLLYCIVFYATMSLVMLHFR